MPHGTRSKSLKSNALVSALARKRGEDNLTWGARAVADMKLAEPGQWSCVALLGGVDTLSFRLRVAQSHLRRDMFPSYWSESILVHFQGAQLDQARAVHVPLLQPEDASYATRRNGVVDRPLTDFADTKRWPNIALIALPVQQAELLAKVESFKAARGTLDALEHILRWLGFAWGAAGRGNPLHDSVGLPSACMLETVCAAAGLDLTPGLESRASCPEAIWVAARHFHDYYSNFHHNQVPQGRFCNPHRYPIE